MNALSESINLHLKAICQLCPVQIANKDELHEHLISDKAAGHDFSADPKLLTKLIVI